MKTIKLYTQLQCISFLLIVCLITSCEKKAVTTTTIVEKENFMDADNIDLALNNMNHYNDSCVNAKNHSSPHLHYYDSFFHHHDSLYSHYHSDYHHGDTAHHHSGWHHGVTQQNSHDSLNIAHHHSIH